MISDLILTETEYNLKTMHMASSAEAIHVASKATIASSILAEPISAIETNTDVIGRVNFGRRPIDFQTIGDSCQASMKAETDHSPVATSRSLESVLFDLKYSVIVNVNLFDLHMILVSISNCRSVSRRRQICSVRTY
jgi:hypothetical protein